MNNRLKFNSKLLIFIVLIVGLLYNFTGCRYFNKDNINTKNVELKPNTQNDKRKDVDPFKQPTEANITLYFKHQFADLLVPEQRKVQKEEQSLEQLVVEELLKGPRKFERNLVMPPNVKVLDVTRKGDTVFVNLSSEFKNNIDLTTLPGKENIPEDKRSRVQAEMKKLAIYSIVNSLTELEGGLQVKILVENKQLTYDEMGAQLLVGEQASINGKTPMTAIYRDKNIILSPSKSVEYMLKGLAGKSNWDVVYLFLASKTMDGSDLPEFDEFKKYASAIGITMEVDDKPVDQEEIKADGNTAYVTVHYTIKYPDGKIEVKDRDVFTVVREEGIWKVKLPELFTKVK